MSSSVQYTEGISLDLHVRLFVLNESSSSLTAPPDEGDDCTDAKAAEADGNESPYPGSKRAPTTISGALPSDAIIALAVRVKLTAIALRTSTSVSA